MFMETEIREAEAAEASVSGSGKAVSAQTIERMKRFHRTVRVNKKTVIGAAVLIVVVGVFYSLRGLFIAAMVDGSPISRWSIVRELEKKSGEQALDALVTKHLIRTAAVKAGVVASSSDVDREITKITEQVTKQGGTLKAALEQQGMTEADFREQVMLQKQLEGILGDKVAVTDEDVASYIAQSKATTPKGITEEDFKNQIREQLKGQKFNTEASKWVSETKAGAKIEYFVPYAPKPLPAKDLSEGAMSSELKQ